VSNCQFARVYARAWRMMLWRPISPSWKNYQVCKHHFDRISAKRINGMLQQWMLEHSDATIQFFCHQKCQKPELKMNRFLSGWKVVMRILGKATPLWILQKMLMLFWDQSPHPSNYFSCCKSCFYSAGVSQYINNGYQSRDSQVVSGF
jgi:hypothetical protein